MKVRYDHMIAMTSFGMSLSVSLDWMIVLFFSGLLSEVIWKGLTSFLWFLSHPVLFFGCPVCCLCSLVDCVVMSDLKLIFVNSIPVGSCMSLFFECCRLWNDASCSVPESCG